MVISDKKAAACKSTVTPQAAKIFSYYRNSQIKVSKYRCLKHLTRRFCKNRRVFRRKTPRRPPANGGISLVGLRNMTAVGFWKVAAAIAAAVTWSPCGLHHHFAVVAERIITACTHNDMVLQANIHQFAGGQQFFRKLAVVLAGAWVAAWVVVA